MSMHVEYVSCVLSSVLQHFDFGICENLPARHEHRGRAASAKVEWVKKNELSLGDLCAGFAGILDATCKVVSNTGITQTLKIQQFSSSDC